MTIKEALARNIQYVRLPQWTGGMVKLPRKVAGLFYGPFVFFGPSGEVKKIPFLEFEPIEPRNDWIEIEQTK